MHIKNCSLEDVNAVHQFYTAAREFQIKKGSTPWPVIDLSLIREEIENKQQWKLMADGKICSLWVTTFEDPDIWGERNNDPSLYLHRIASNPDLRGQRFLPRILDWSKDYALANNREFLRLDTAGINTGLINLYIRHGFKLLKVAPLKNTTRLLSHYQNVPVCFFEINLEPVHTI